MHRLSLLAGALALGVASAGPAAAADNVDKYPDRPIRLVVSFPPGGATDVAVRFVVPRASEILGQQIVIENKAGAGGNLATALMKNADRDGYHFLANSSAFAVNPSLTTNAGFDPIKDFTPVIQLVTQPNLIVVTASFEAKSLQDILRIAKEKPLSWASPGNGTTPHLTGEHLFKVITRSGMVHIPFKGGGPANTGVISGEPPVGIMAVSGPIGFVKQGKMRAIAISSAQRHPSLPEVPTLTELGYQGLEDYTWIAIFAPAGTPMPLVRKFNAALNEAMRDPKVKERLDASLLDPVGGTPEEFANYLKAEVAKWSKVVQLTGAKVD